jgi:hypothetical protein
VTTKQHSSSAEHRQQHEFDAEIAITPVTSNLESCGEPLQTASMAAGEHSKVQLLYHMRWWT